MNSKELELLCGALSITEKERPVGTLDYDLKAKGERVLALCLVGKVLTTKVVNKEAFINVMHSIWKTSEEVEIEALEGNVFAFHFKTSEDRKYIQSGGPWSFDRALTALEEPTGAGDIALMKFNKVEIWVQIHNIPLICSVRKNGLGGRLDAVWPSTVPNLGISAIKIEESGHFLGAMIGEVKDVDLLAAKSMGGRFIRVRVIISSDDSLMRSVRVDLLGTGEITTMLLSPPKRIHNRRGPFGRQSWGNQNGVPYSRADHGNWRAGISGRKPPDVSSGGHGGIGRKRSDPMTGVSRHPHVSRQDSQVGGLPEGQVGVQHSIEPCTNLMRTDAAINVLGGDKISEINFKVGKEKQVQAAEVICQQTPPHSDIQLGQFDGPALVNRMMVDLPIESGPTRVNDSRPTSGLVLKSDIADPSGFSNAACGNIVSDILKIMKVLGYSSVLTGKKGSNKSAFALARQALSRKSNLIWRRQCR
ncbi:hypothetical protein EZV62_018786 [Acer yangbiense]|uniref:DUF4283 domain-containing protein n=1 Tax=Acer yangbiense TaxID=1000413 RepID=A0A5C7H906_9ROSI|nr:hypothetical protein EZV62_018786 [Acer yangbiense]